MDNLIEPNWHPIVVHFVVAFVLTSPVLLLLVSLAPEGMRWRKPLQAAGDWMLALGVIAAILAVAAGLQAYYSVAHDSPSHAAMTDHRNFAFATLALLGAFAIWRYATRSSAPSKLFAALFIAATLLPATTAWKGGRLVYHHGLGVASLPAAEGEGHDHDHAPGHGRGEEDHEDASSAQNDGHDHGDAGERETGDVHDHGGDAAAESSGGAPNAEPAAAFDEASYPATPEAVADAFSAALSAKDEAAARALLAPDVIIAEGGGAERSVDEYAGRHMPADMAFTAAVDFTLKDRSVSENGDMAVVISQSQVHGTYNDQAVHSQMMETLILINSGGGWRIKHIHWSSAPITGAHEH